MANQADEYQDGEPEFAERGESASIHAELHRRAAAAMRRQPAHHTLQATALVNEVYLKLHGGGSRKWNDRKHFLATAAKAMRQILVDYARRKDVRPVRHEGSSLSLAELPDMGPGGVDVASLNDCLEELAKFDPEMAKAIELRFFAGASRVEVARTLGLSERTFDRRWQAARAWILSKLQ